MKTIPSCRCFPPFAAKMPGSKALFSVFLAIAWPVCCFAQAGPSGTVSGAGAGPFTYSLSFSNAANATTPIGSIWYSWVPGQFFLPSVPTSAGAPAGWSAVISGNSVQYVASSAADDISPGENLSGFSYGATFSPSQLAAAPNSGESVAYSGGLFSDAGVTFDVVLAQIPEPSPAKLWLIGIASLLSMRHLQARRRSA